MLRRRGRRADLGEERVEESLWLRPEAPDESYLIWFGGFVCLILLVGAVAVVAGSNGWLRLGGSPAVLAAGQQTEFSPAQANRTDCATVGSSDLRSPSEGLWYQSNCASAAEPQVKASSTTCNRAALDPGEFTEVSAGLYVFRQARASQAFLWYASSDTCFDLVSARVVTAVCADQAVTFEWNVQATCASHGGVLALVNGN